MMRVHNAARRERGATLIIALVFLVIMAMLGVTVANVTSLQEKMAGNTRDRDLALQAAEAALRDAQIRLATDVGFRTAAIPWNPADAARANDDDFWEACFTTNAAPCIAADTKGPLQGLPSEGSGAIAAAPEYIVERRPDDGATQVYRVTVRAVGGTSNAVVILQAEYGI
jgi:type IV pilus assembly protein PilX